jgi:hypothetical protein
MPLHLTPPNGVHGWRAAKGCSECGEMTSITPSLLAFLEADPVAFHPGHEGGPADLFGEIQANETRMEFGLYPID